MKAWVVLHDVALVAVLIAWTRRRTGRVGPVIAYAWNPLVLAGFAGQAHAAPTAMLWMVVALAWAERRAVASAGALGLAMGTQLAAVLALPALLRRWPWRARLVALALLAAGAGTWIALTRGAGFAPVLRIWDLGWVLVLGPSAPWLLLLTTVLLSYGVLAPPLAGGAYHVPPAWRWVTYGIPLLLAAGVALARRRGRRPPEGA